MRAVFVAILLPLLPACGLRTAAALREPGVRVELADRLVATLDRQDHYFATETDRDAFARRLGAIAREARDASTYYTALSDALASLGEGHTGLVGSEAVPFSSTIPPVALLEVDGTAVVAGVAPGVEGGGLRPGDAVLEVDGVPAHRAIEGRLEVTSGSTPHGRRARAVSNLLAGPTRVPARVRVRGIDGRERTAYPLRFLLDDEGIHRFRFGFVPPALHDTALSPAVLYLSLPDFHPDRRGEVEEVLQRLGDMPELVLDLRGNPGGRIRTLQRIAGFFIDGPETLVMLQEGAGMQPVRALPGPVRYRGRVHLLVDERTGSAAELLAAALQDLGRATVYGRTTAGSARSRLSALLPGNVVFHYAGRAEFRRRDGRRIEGRGIEPDVFYQPQRDELARGIYGDPHRDPLIRLALGRN